MSSNTQTVITHKHRISGVDGRKRDTKSTVSDLSFLSFFAQMHNKHRTDINTKINTYFLKQSTIVRPHRRPQHIHQVINQNAIIQRARSTSTINRARTMRTHTPHHNHQINHPFHTSIIATNNVKQTVT